MNFKRYRREQKGTNEIRERKKKKLGISPTFSAKETQRTKQT